MSRFLRDLVDFGELPLRKQGSLDLPICDTIHGLAKADYSLFDQIATGQALRDPCVASSLNNSSNRRPRSSMSLQSFSYDARVGFSGYLTALIVASVLAGTPAFGEEKPLQASKLFPADTQALFSLPDSQGFLAGWGKTQLGKLADDPKLKAFWETQRKEIQDRFNEAGWQLNLEVEDISEMAGGQTTLGWISRSSDENKPFSIAMVIDAVNRSEPAERFLKRLDSELKSRNATAKEIEIGGANVFQYTLPKATGDVRVNESFYSLSSNQLLAADDLVTITELLAAQRSAKEDSLANSELYKQAQSKIPTEGDEPELEYFVRPIGFAKLLRSISGKPTKNQSDVLLILDKEGFGDLQCIAGNIQISAEPFDFFHHAYMVAKKPLATSVQILDFPNVAKLVAPDWINKESASVLSFSWDIKEAFPKFKGIVDAFVGPGTFDEMIKGLRDDTQGPQIDILKDVLPFLSSEFHVVTEIVKPISPDSKRSMVILKLNDAGKKLPKILDRYGKGEPDSKPVDFEGNRIWSFENKEDTEIELDFGGKKDAKNKPADEDEPLLDKWAITIFGDYFIFASDVEMIMDVLSRAKNPGQKNAFEKETDVTKVSAMLENVAGNDGRSTNQITRSDRAFEMQYELFRQDILPESRSMLATILDKILKPKNPRQTQVQRVKGDKLPPFGAIRDFFTPSGGVMRTEDDGWSIQGFILGK